MASTYTDKISFLLDSSYPEVSPLSFYRDLFPVGSFERCGHPEDACGNGMLCKLSDKADMHPENRIIFDDLNIIADYQNQPGVIISPCSYAGKRRLGALSRYCFALAFDIDGVESSNLQDFIYECSNDILPMPTYIAVSGGGIHAYYLFNDPIPLYPEYRTYLKELKYALTLRLWNDYTSTDKQRQFQGIYQAFRAVGTLNKDGYPVRCFRIGYNCDVDYLMSFLPDERSWPPAAEVSKAAVKAIDLFQDADYRATLSKKLVRDQSVSLEEAKKLYPEWYQKRVIEKRPVGRWTNHRALYDWWLRRIRGEIQVGHRYNAIVTLAIYAKKCNISDEELRRDAYSLFDRYESLTMKEDNHFRREEIAAALTAAKEDYVRFPRKDIARLAGIEVRPNKRNGRKQDKHLAGARAIQNINDPDGHWRDGNGRKNKKQQIKDWQKQHPDGKKADCVRDTGLSKPTVYKWWGDDKN